MAFEHLHLAVTSRRRAIQELLLLSDHLTDASARCPRCILKHAMKADAYAKEAVALTGATQADGNLSALTGHILELIIHEGDLTRIPAMVRALRE